MSLLKIRGPLLAKLPYLRHKEHRRQEEVHPGAKAMLWMSKNWTCFQELSTKAYLSEMQTKTSNLSP